MNKIITFTTSKFDQLLFYIKNPHFYKYFPSFIKMQFTSTDIPAMLVNEPYLPWYTYDSICWVKKYIKNHKKVFEYGSGNSTLFYLQNNTSVYSVEHDIEWYNKIKNIIIRNNKFCKLSKNIQLKEPTLIKNAQNDKNFMLDYSAYISSIKKFPNFYFDLVVIDGRSRNRCVDVALNKIKKGGYLLFDNSERSTYKESINKLKIYKKTDFIGRGPYINTIWQTTIWKIR